MTKPSAVRSFFDTNLLSYADAGDEPEKQKRALALTKEIEEIVMPAQASSTEPRLRQYYYIRAAARNAGHPPARV